MEERIEIVEVSGAPYAVTYSGIGVDSGQWLGVKLTPELDQAIYDYNQKNEEDDN